MKEARDAVSYGFDRARVGATRFARSVDVPKITGSGTRSLEAWFLGPKAENADVLEALIVDAIRDQAHWRRNYHPGDPTHITEAIKRSPEYLDALGSLKDGYRELLAFLKKSVPFFSMRYQGHMNWDLTIPGIVGYFSAMLYNPNNVAFEGSTATTILELLVGDDLCRMLGYVIPNSEAADDSLRPWGHVTCDGTVANIEAIWSARNLKLFPLALQEAARKDERLKGALGIEISTTAGPKALADADTWTLLNLSADEILALPTRIGHECGIMRTLLTEAISPFTPQTLGLGDFHARHLGSSPSPVFLVPGTKHYSFPKAAALLGIGAGNMIDVPVDLDARLDVGSLRRILEGCLSEKRPVYTVVCVIGSTEESAVDPIADVLELREEFRGKGLDFTVHADAAWGGYHASVVRDDFDMPGLPHFVPPPPALQLSRYVTKQFDSLGQADSITVDPHKSGYIPYPAGALCYRNSAMRDLVTFSAPVVYHGDAEPTVGIYGVEGSKPGAAAAAVYLSHRVIRPSKSGYGKIIGQALFSCRKLYARLLCMAASEDPFIVVPLPRLARIDGRSEEEILAGIAELDRQDTGQIQASPQAMELLGEIGPDQNILAYAFNFKHPDGTINADLDQCNRLNKTLYEKLSIDPGKDIYEYDLIVSTTDLDASHYGMEFIEDYKRRLGVEQSDGSSITVLRSVVMDPWVTETAHGSFIDVLEREFRKAALMASEEVTGASVRGY